MPDAETRRISDLPDDIKRDAAPAGIETAEKGRSGSFFQIDQQVFCAASNQPGVELLDTGAALKKYDGLKEYFWRAVDPEKDEFTRAARDAEPHGYFIRALPGVESIFPLQACLFIRRPGTQQKVHNIIIAEEGAKLHIITGCTVGAQARSGMHIGISEFYVKKNASITFTMIHNWQEGIEVRPRSVTRVEEGGVFINNYICLKPVKLLQMYPTVNLVGRGSRAVFSSVLLGKGKSQIDMGSRVILQAENSSAQIISRAVARDESRITARGQLVGEVPKIKAHLECRGLVLSPKASIYAIPELEAKQENLEMSHEAAVGKIDEKEILYLMSRGLSQDEATAAIIRGFLKVDLEGLPDKLKAEIDKLTEMEYQG